MRHLGVCLLLAVAAQTAQAIPAFAQAGGPELKTDDPYYPGEGALSTPARAVAHAWATPRGAVGTGTDREKLIRLFLWRAEHYCHLVSPAVYNLPGVTPDPSADNSLMTDYDAMRTMFSYGWGVCGTNHAQMRVFADAAGWESRRRALVGDTGYEIFVNGGWRYCNTDQYTLHFLSNSGSAHFASLDEVINTNHHYAEWNPDPGLGYAMPQANTHGNYQDFAGVTGTVPFRSLQWRSYYNGVWAPVAGGNYKMYGEGYTTTPVVVRLRRGETFTRWLSPSGAVNDLGLSGKAWWGFNGGNMGGGDNAPFSPWSFTQNAPARDQTSLGAPEESAKVGQRHGNGCFLWQPSLAAGEDLDGTLEVTGTLTRGGSPALKSSGASKLVLFQYTPYTIAARPSDATDPANSASDGAVITADAVGSVGVEVSVNAGATWSSIGSLSGTGASLDFTNNVKGRNQYLLRLSFDDAEGLNSLTLRTLTVMSQGVYPNLKSGTAQVTYTSANAGALDLSPDLWSSATANSATGYVQKVADSGNLTGVFYGGGSAYAYSSTDNNPISVTYKLTMPPALASAGATWKQIFGAANSSCRVPPDGGPYTRVEISPNQSTWTQIGEYLPPVDNEFSSYWAYGRSADATTLGGTSYYVRFTASNGPHPCSFRYFRIGATYTMPASAAPVEVTYTWNGNQTDVHTVAAGATTDSWSIPTGTVTSQEKVALKIASGAATPSAPAITIQPADRTVTAGQTATFSVTATGTAPLQYQWKKNGTDIPGATGSSYTTPATTLADSGTTYQVVVSNGQGSVASRTATLTVTAAGPGGGSTTLTLQEGVNGYAGTTDTYIDEKAPTSSFGTTDRLEVRWYDDGTGLSEHMITLIRFDLSSIPSGATVTSAKLTLYNTRAAANGGSDVVTLDKVTSAWTEANTWQMGVPSAAPTGVTCPTVAGYTISPNPPEIYTITGLGALVQGWVTTPGSNFGLMLSTTTNLNIRFASSEYGTAQYRPALEVTYTTGGGADTTPPTLTITSPAPGAASSSPLAVTGTASDAGGISQVTWTNANTGQSGTATGTTSWSASIPLGPGTNDITITATDLAGNSTSTVLTMTYSGGSPGTGGGGGGGGGSHHMCGIGAASQGPGSLGIAGMAALLLILAMRRR